MKDLYVVNCCRTAVGSYGGSLKDVPAAQLGAIVVKEALKRANVAPENVDELMFGCILTAGLGQNVARQVGVKAGLPYSVPAYTVGMVCGSGMKSVIEAARCILAGDADIVVAGGTENTPCLIRTLPSWRLACRQVATTSTLLITNRKTRHISSILGSGHIVNDLRRLQQGSRCRQDGAGTGH